MSGMQSHKNVAARGVRTSSARCPMENLRHRSDPDQAGLVLRGSS